MNQKMTDSSFHSTPNLKLKDIHEFTMQRFMEINGMNDLVKFHSINKYLIMAHSPNLLNKLGNIVANHDGLKFNEILENYYFELKKAFDFVPTMKSHFNTLQHIFGHFSPDFSNSEKRYFLKMLENFRLNRISLNEILETLKDSSDRYEKLYLSRQTYFLFFTNKI